MEFVECTHDKYTSMLCRCLLNNPSFVNTVSHLVLSNMLKSGKDITKIASGVIEDLTINTLGKEYESSEVVACLLSIGLDLINWDDIGEHFVKVVLNNPIKK